MAKKVKKPARKPVEEEPRIGASNIGTVAGRGPVDPSDEEDKPVEEVDKPVEGPVTDEEPEPRLQSTESPTPVLPVTEVDYLRKYQFRDQAVMGSPQSDPREGTKAFTMKKNLLSQPRVRMLVPRAMGEDKSVMQTVNLNGYRLDFPKDAYIDVPEQVADVLMESLNQTNAALQIKRIDSDSKKEAALL